MSQIKEQIEQGAYHVDPAAVAEAILRRIRSLPAGLDMPLAPGSERSRPPQNECSYPVN